MSTNDLQALFANLKSTKQRTSPAASQASIHGQPASNGNTAPLQAALPPSSPPPSFASVFGGAHMAPASSGPSSTNAQSLLSLLNFGTAAEMTVAKAKLPEKSAQKTSTEVDQDEAPAKISHVSATDLLAKFMSPPTTSIPAKAPSPLNLEDQGGGGNRSTTVSGRDASQDALLSLLNRTHPAHSANIHQQSSEIPLSQPAEETKSPSRVENLPVRTSSPPQAFASTATRNNVPFETARADPIASTSIFTYTNPFEALNASRSATPKTYTPIPVPAPIPSHADSPRPTAEAANEPQWEGSPTLATAAQVARRKILTPKRLSSTHRQASTVSREPSTSLAADEARDNQDVHSVEESARTRTSNPAVPVSHDAVQVEIVGETLSKDDVDNDQSSARGVDNQADGADEWEDAEESPSKDDTSRFVPVYNFPIKPFVSITLQFTALSQVGIRDDGVMEISRLKKEFDQVDRSLAAATSKYITYALVKNGGMRIIRQDDGSDHQVFKNTHDRIFNVAFCTTSSNGPPSDDQAVLGTGVSGAVYYATVSKSGNDLFEKNDLESESVVFPPYPPADENTAGGVLKTRAKRSSHHPEFFAIGRGKSIHLIWPATALSTRYGVSDGNRQVDVDRFFQERTLQILTGKAGKDFTFSEDDTLIVSLDKTGRLRFWDIRKLIDESNATAAHVSGMTVDMPLLSLSTASPAEKSWPTSVLFVDKARPYIKGGALRYVLVGLRQNHTLQLWDIALGKAVQELNFPHEHETDGICNVNYHPGSGIIVVGHPTRNSIFFIHLSAPRYTLSSSLSQAAYVQRIAAKDPEVPKPDSTACMSGIRELSFADKGQLRSVELLPIYRPPDDKKSQKSIDVKTPLFELYVVHSKGVTCLNITKEDLGWNAESKVIHPVDANREGLLSLKELRLGSVIEEPPLSKSPVYDAATAVKTSKKKSGKKGTAISTERADDAQGESSEPVKSLPQPLVNGAASPQVLGPSNAGDSATTKEGKKSKKKTAVHPSTDLAAVAKDPSGTATSAKFTPTNLPQLPHPETSVPPAPSPPEMFPPNTDGERLSQREGTVTLSPAVELRKLSSEISTQFQKELSALYQNIQNDRVVQDSAAGARQEALLRLVSSTLSNNVEKSIARQLSNSLQQVVVPALVGATVQAVTSQVGEAVTKALHSLVPQELSVQLPVAINSALQNPQMSRTISDNISQRVSKQAEAQLIDLLQAQIVPSFKNLAVSTAESAASEVEFRLKADIRQLETERRRDFSRMEKLSQVLQGMAETLQQMSDTQVTFQRQILKDRQQLGLLGDREGASSRQVSTARLTPSPLPTTILAAQKPKSKELLELEEISQMMEVGSYEEASIRWLQSGQQAELFDKLFMNFTPEYLATDVSPLIAFSIGVTVGNALQSNTSRRLEWIYAAFNAVDVNDPEIADLAGHAPALLASLITRLESLYMTIAEQNPTDPALQMMPMVSRKAKEMKSSLAVTGGYGQSVVSPYQAKSK